MNSPVSSLLTIVMFITSLSISFSNTASELKLNQLQLIGTHNSFKLSMPEKELKLINLFDNKAALELDYGFDKTLTEQLEQGARLLELDLYYDPLGGRYAEPLMSSIPFIGSAHPKPDLMNKPGFKVMHVQDVDYRSSCYLFSQCLEQLKSWSEQNNSHLPVMVLINLKQEDLGIWGTTTPLLYDKEAMVALEQELISVMSTKLVTPNVVKAGSQSLSQTIKHGGWPELGDLKGKFIFLLDSEISVLEKYNKVVNTGSLFSSWPETHPEAGIFVINDPIGKQSEIQKLVRQGFIVRTRADANTYEARNNNKTRMQAAFDSGAQFIATDYLEANFRLSPYKVAFNNGKLQRCNPLLTSKNCVVND